MEELSVVDARSAPDRQQGLLARLRDAASFWAVILFSAVAIAMLAIATPFVLALSAIAGAVGCERKSTWREARA